MLYDNLDASTGVLGDQLSQEQESQAARYQSNWWKQQAKNERVKLLTVYWDDVRD